MMIIEPYELMRRKAITVAAELAADSDQICDCVFHLSKIYGLDNINMIKNSDIDFIMETIRKTLNQGTLRIKT